MREKKGVLLEELGPRRGFTICVKRGKRTGCQWGAGPVRVKSIEKRDVPCSRPRKSSIKGGEGGYGMEKGRRGDVEKFLGPRDSIVPAGFRGV